ncbi:MAG TPA: hypothetical protein VKV17_09480 [Bryobacteraceae bacterium]|nr:hypothetical protein [Bryobacteraceae bacterium]
MATALQVIQATLVFVQALFVLAVVIQMQLGHNPGPPRQRQS